MADVVVLIPGIMGSELKLKDKLIWPGPPHTLLLPYRLMEELMREDLVATGVIETYSITTQYKALIDDLATLEFTDRDQSLVVFPYDWRKNNTVAAYQLADRLDMALKDSGPETTFTLLAHSMGGLVARYYLESGDFNGRAAYLHVKQLITLATPHRGAPLALPRILGLEKVLWLSAADAKELTNDTKFPSAYQLLPPISESFAWNSAPEGYGNESIYNPATATALGLNPASLKAAGTFHARLNPSNRPSGVRYFCFSGTRQSTASFATLTKNAAGGFNVRKVERDDAGDGTVPFWSSSLPGIQCLPTGNEHSVIYKDRALRRTLATLLGMPGALGGLADFPAGIRVQNAIEVSIRDKVVVPQQALHIVLVPFQAANGIDAELQIERADEASGPNTNYTAVGAPIAIQYNGPAVESFGVMAEAPLAPGAYRIVVILRQSGDLAGFDTFLVQALAPAC